MSIFALLAFDPTISAGNLIVVVAMLLGWIYNVARTMTIIDQIRSDQSESKRKQEEQGNSIGDHGERLATVEAMVRLRSSRSHGD